MKLTFTKIKKNIKAYKAAYEVFPQIQLYYDNKLDWKILCDLELNDIIDVGNLFKVKKYAAPSKEDVISVITGEIVVDFNFLKNMIINESSNLYSDGVTTLERKKKAGIEGTFDKPEVKKLYSAFQFAKNMDEKTFCNVFSSSENYKKLFPNLYTLQLDIYSGDGVCSHVNNYLAHNKIEIAKEVYDGELDYYIEYYKRIAHVPKTKEVISMLTKMDNSDKIADILLDAINKSGSVSWDYLFSVINNTIHGIDQEKMSNTQKANDRSEIIDKLVK